MTAIPLFFLSNWHRYTWGRYGPLYAPAVFTNFGVSGIDWDAVVISCTLAKAGNWSVLFGAGGAAPNGRTNPRTVAAGVGDSVNVTGLKPKTLYLVTVTAEVTDPNPNGLPLSGNYYTDPQTFTTLAAPPGYIPLDEEINLLFPEEAA